MQMAIWIALGVVFIALIPVFLNAMRDTANERDKADKRGDGTTPLIDGTGSRKSIDHDSGADGGDGGSGGDGDGGGGGGGD